MAASKSTNAKNSTKSTSSKSSAAENSASRKRAKRKMVPKTSAPDIDQCMGVKQNMGALGMTAPPPERCTNKPTKLLTTKALDEKGVIHSMTICEQCLSNLNRNVLPESILSEIVFDVPKSDSV